MYEIGEREIEAVAEVIRSGKLFRYRGGEGGRCDACEQSLREIFGCAESIVVTSGTGALVCALVGLGVGPGDEVIVPAYTWLASAGAVLGVGAIPVLAEIDESLTLDPAALEGRVGPRTKAVIPVHMGGRPSDMGPIMEVAGRHGLAVLEDSCQAVGGSYRGRRLGTIGRAGALSFNFYKIVTCGEGGAVLTGEKQVYERALLHHDMGCSFRGHQLSEPRFLGSTFRMNEILAAVLHVQLGRLDSILARLRERRRWILEAVAGSGAPLAETPSRDTEGDCGVFASFLFASAAEREAVAARAAELDPECVLASPIDSGMHVYTNWRVLLDRKGAAHPAMNPFMRLENRLCRMDIAPGSCPRTLEILARSAAFAIDPGMSRERCLEIAAVLARAAREAGEGA